MLLFDSKCVRQSFPSSIYHLIINWIVSFTLISHHVKPMLTIQKITANLYRYIWIFNRFDSFQNPSFTSPLDPIQKIKSPFLFNHNRSSHNKLFISRITIVSNQFDNSNFYELISYINSWLFYFFYWLWNRAPARQNRKIISKEQIRKLQTISRVVKIILSWNIQSMWRKWSYKVVFSSQKLYLEFWFFSKSEESKPTKCNYVKATIFIFIEYAEILWKRGNKVFMKLHRKLLQ